MIMSNFTRSMEKINESRFVEERDQTYQNQNQDIDFRIYELENALREEKL